MSGVSGCSGLSDNSGISGKKEKNWNLGKHIDSPNSSFMVVQSKKDYPNLLTSTKAVTECFLTLIGYILPVTCSYLILWKEL